MRNHGERWMENEMIMLSVWKESGEHILEWREGREDSKWLQQTWGQFKKKLTEFDDRLNMENK